MDEERIQDLLPDRREDETASLEREPKRDSPPDQRDVLRSKVRQLEVTSKEIRTLIKQDPIHVKVISSTEEVLPPETRDAPLEAIGEVIKENHAKLQETTDALRIVLDKLSQPKESVQAAGPDESRFELFQQAYRLLTQGYHISGSLVILEGHKGEMLLQANGFETYDDLRLAADRAMGDANTAFSRLLEVRRPLKQRVAERLGLSHAIEDAEQEWKHNREETDRLDQLARTCYTCKSYANIPSELVSLYGTLLRQETSDLVESSCSVAQSILDNFKYRDYEPSGEEVSQLLGQVAVDPENLRSFIKYIHIHAEIRDLSEQVQTSITELESVHEALNNTSSSVPYQSIRHLSELSRQLQDSLSSQFIHDITYELPMDEWKALRDHPAAQEAFDPSELQSADRYLANLIRTSLIGSAHRSKDKINLGRRILNFHDEETVPLAILNCYQEVGASGEYPLNSYFGSQKDTELFKYISSTPDDVLSACYVPHPALEGLVTLIRDNPDIWNTSDFYGEGVRVNNPVYYEVQQKLAELANDYLQPDSPQLNSLIWDLLSRARANLSPIYDRVTSGELPLTSEALHTASYQIQSYKNDEGFDFLGKSLPTIVATKDQSLAKAASKELGTLSKYLCEPRSDTPPDKDTRIPSANRLRSLLGEAGGLMPLLHGEGLYTFLVAIEQARLTPEEITSLLSADPASTSLDNSIFRNLRDLSSNDFIERGASCLAHLITLAQDPSAAHWLEDELKSMPTRCHTAVSSGFSDFITSPLRSWASHKAEETEATFFRDRLAEWIHGDSIELSRQAALTFSQAFRSSRVPAAEGIPYETGLYKSIEEIRPSMLEHPDPLVHYLGLTIAVYAGEVPDGQGEFITEFILGEKALRSSGWGTVISPPDFILNFTHQITTDQAKRIASYLSEDSEEASRFGELALVLLLSHKLEEGDIPSEIFQDDIQPLQKESISGLLENLEIVDETNWLSALLAYIAQTEDPHIQLPAHHIETVKALFDMSETKDICLAQVREMWVSTLQALSEGGDKLTSRLLNATVDKYGGAGNLKYIEAICLLLSEVRESVADSRENDSTRTDLLTGLLEQERILSERGWSEDEKHLFYTVTQYILEASPSLTTDLLSLIGILGPNELRFFISGLYPLYQAQLVTLEKPVASSRYQSKPTPAFPGRKLVEVRRNLEELRETLGEADDPSFRQKLLERDRTWVLEQTKTNIREQFGILKIPEQLDDEAVRTLSDLTTYLGNLNATTEGKRYLLSFILGIILNGEWQSLRSGELLQGDKPFNLDEYVSPDSPAYYFLTGYLAKRKEIDPVSASNLGIPQEDIIGFRTLLQEDTVSQLTGAVQTIDSKAETVMQAISALADPDTYTNPRDKGLLDICMSHDKGVGKILAKTFQEASGKSADFTPEEARLKDEVAALCDIDEWTTEKVKQVQDAIKPISLVSKAFTKIGQLQVKSQLEGLREKLNPSDEVIEVFKKLGEVFTPESGAAALPQDLAYLEAVVSKDREQLSEADRRVVSEYFAGIYSQMQVVETIFDTLKELAMKLISSLKGTELGDDPVFASRIASIEEAWSVEAGYKEIVTRMTSDLRLVIENIRACLGCRSKECNNDTNLSFADSNRFLIINQSSSQRGSVADQLVSLYPAAMDEGKPGMAFIMDVPYGLRTADILISNILCVFKKYQQLNASYPEANLGILISNVALNGSGLTEELLQKRLQSAIGIDFSLEKRELDISVPPSPTGDPYMEFSGTTRGTEDRQVSGYLLRLKDTHIPL